MSNGGSESPNSACGESSLPVSAAVIGPTINEQTLEALRTAGQSFRIPSVAIAAGIALSIYEVVQTVKTDNEDFFAIGRDSCFVVEIVIERVQVGRNGRILDDPVVLRYTDVLIADLRYIERHVRKVKGRHGVKKIFNLCWEQKIIQGCRERLLHAMVLFSLRYDIETCKQLASVHNLPPEASSYSPSPPIQSQPRWQIPSSSFPLDPSQQLQGMPNVTPSSPTGSPTGTGSNSPRYAQNHRSSVGHGLVVGNVNDTRDDSFNVFGTGNIINFSFVR